MKATTVKVNKGRSNGLATLGEVETSTTKKTVQIAAPNFKIAEFHLKGTAPLVVNKFPQKAREMMKAKQEAGAQAKKGAKREAKDFELCFQQARHISRDGWDGIPAAAFRAAMVSACRLVNFKMTIAKMAVFILAEGIDRDEGTALVKIIGDEPIRLEMATRNETGVCDIRVRPQWLEWGCVLKIRYDGDLFSLEDVSNLLMRAGMQVGVCEGRPDSKNSTGMGWGTFEIERKGE